MIRVYLDQNIYTRFKNTEKRVYLDVLNIFEKYDRYILPIYSSAHFYDLSSDSKSNYLKDKPFRLEEIRLIQNITKGNHLAYDLLNKRVGYYLVKDEELDSQLDVFNKLSLKNTFDNIYANDTYGMANSMMGLFNEYMKVLFKSFDTSLYDESNTPKYILDMIKNPDSADFFSNEGVGRLFTNNKDYTDNKKISSKLFHISSDYIYESILNQLEEYSKKYFGYNTFVEYLNKNTTIKDQFNYDVSLYTTLDFFGYKMDKKFSNLLTDSQHYAYSTHCDYFVTDDLNLIMKGLFCNRFHNIKNKILDIHSFYIELLHLVNNINSHQSILEVAYDALKNKLSYNTITNNLDNTTLYLLDYFYLGHFNRIQLFDDLNEYKFIFTKNSKNRGVQVFYHEIDSMLELLSQKFGTKCVVESSNDLLFVDDVSNYNSHTISDNSITWSLGEKIQVVFKVDMEVQNWMLLQLIISKI